MAIIVIYHMETMEVVAVIPVKLMVEKECTVHFEVIDALLRENYSYDIYSNSEPIFDTSDGIVRLKKNSFIMNSNHLIGK